MKSVERRIDLNIYDTTTLRSQSSGRSNYHSIMASFGGSLTLFLTAAVSEGQGRFVSNKLKLRFYGSDAVVVSECVSSILFYHKIYAWLLC